jgi:hypothetical protein
MTPTQEQQAQLAAEMNAAIVPDWQSVLELIEYRGEVTVGSKKRTLTFGEIVTQYKDLDAQIEALETRKKDFKASIQAAVLMSGREKVSAEGYRMTMIKKAGTKKIVPEKLLKHGVSAEVIAACTEIGKGSEYLDIRAEKSKD